MEKINAGINRRKRVRTPKKIKIDFLATIKIDIEKIDRAIELIYNQR